MPNTGTDASRLLVRERAVQDTLRNLEDLVMVEVHRRCEEDFCAALERKIENLRIRLEGYFEEEERGGHFAEQGEHPDSQRLASRFVAEHGRLLSEVDALARRCRRASPRHLAERTKALIRGLRKHETSERGHMLDMNNIDIGTGD